MQPVDDFSTIFGNQNEPNGLKQLGELFFFYRDKQFLYKLFNPCSLLMFVWSIQMEMNNKRKMLILFFEYIYYNLFLSDWSWAYVSSFETFNFKSN